MIEDLRRFVIIFETGSITKAAKTFGLTQPAISFSLKRLENELKTKLIVTSKRQISITQDGKSIYQTAVKLLNIWDSMKNPKLRVEKKKISVGLFDNAAIILARTPILKNKDYQIELIIDNSSNLRNLIAQGVLDLCICVIDKKPDIDNAIFLTKYQEELIPVSSVAFNLPINKVPFLLYNKISLTRKYIDETFYKNSLNPLVVAESSSTSFLKELALQGTGIALLPKNFVSAELENKALKIQRLPLSWKREIGIYLSRKTDLTTSSQFMTSVIKALKTKGAHP